MERTAQCISAGALRYLECNTALDPAGRLIGTELAEPRNLIFRNPTEGTDFTTTKTFDWERADTLTAPTLDWIEQEARTATILFSMLDEFLMRFSHYYRFEGAQ